MVDFTIKSLEIFVTVVEQSSFSLAAEILYLSQSSISTAISTLEKTFGLQLLDRNTRKKIRLTSEGEVFYAQAKNIVEKCVDLQKNFAGGSCSPLLIGTTSATMYKFLPDLMRDFSKACPACRYVFEHANGDKLHDMLRNGDIRIALVVKLQGASIFSYIPMGYDRYVFAAPATEKYLAMKERGATGEQLLMEPMIGGVDHVLLKYIKYFGISYEKLNIVARVKNADAVKALIVQNIGVSIVSLMSVQREVDEGKIVTFDLKRPGMERMLYMAYRNDIRLSNCEQQFIDYVKEHYQTER